MKYLLFTLLFTLNPLPVQLFFCLCQSFTLPTTLSLKMSNRRNSVWEIKKLFPLLNKTPK